MQKEQGHRHEYENDWGKLEDCIHALESNVLKELTLIVPLISLPFHTCVSSGTYRPSLTTRSKTNQYGNEKCLLN